MKIAIIGCGPTNTHAPWDDPSWIKWGLRQDNDYWHRFDVIFEIHKKEMFPSWSKIKERLENVDVPIYMREDYGIDGSVVYPYEKVANKVGWYFTSSIAYMLALAIHNDVDEIGIWGVDLDEDEHGYQRPNFEYLIGFARGKGIKVTLLDSSPLLKAPLYGY